MNPIKAKKIAEGNDRMLTGLTPMQQVFVKGIVQQTLNPSAAARLAGYAAPYESSASLARSPHVVLAIRQERMRLFECDLGNVAAETLRSIMTDTNAPASARVSAARTVLEVTKELGRRQEDSSSDKQLSEMSADELASLIDKWQGERASLAIDITPGAESTPALPKSVDRAQHLAQLIPDSTT
jgi:phage terminase small subunit